MNKAIIGSAILALLFSNIANAASYLCVAEVGAGVSEGKDGNLSSSLYNVDTEKYILSDEGGDWKLSELGKEYSYLDSCSEQGNLCERLDGWAGTFMRNTENGIFSITTLRMLEDGVQSVIVMKGRCSKFN